MHINLFEQHTVISRLCEVEKESSNGHFGLTMNARFHGKYLRQKIGPDIG